jgi:hypothetical protein
MVGCSSANNENPTIPQPVDEQGSIQVLSSGTIEINLDSMAITQHESRQSDYVYNITGFLPSKCPGGCFRFKILGIVGTVLTIQLTIENPTNIQVYDVRIVFADTYGKTVMNPDSYTDFVGVPIGTIRPFIAFAKEYPNRAFPVGPGGIDTEILYLDFPGGSPAYVNYVITANLPGPTQEPYEINSMTQTGTLTQSGGTAEISCVALDHQDNISHVYLYSTSFGGGMIEMIEDPIIPDLYKVEIGNPDSMPIGTYQLLIQASSPNTQGINIFNFVEVTISEDIPVDVIYVDNSYTGTEHDGTMAHPFITIPSGLNAASEGYEVWVDDSGVDYIGSVANKSGVTLKSVNWDTSDGGEMASIYYDAGGAVVGSAENAVMDGFKIYGSTTTGVYISHDNFTIRNCWITEIGLVYSSSIVEGMRISDCDGAVVEKCEFSNIWLNNPEGSGILDAIYLLGATNATIKQCKFHDFYRNTSSGICLSVYFNTCDNVEFSNNIIYDIRANDSVVAVCYFNTTTNGKVINNVIYDLNNGGSASGISVDNESFGFIGINNIIGGFIGTGAGISSEIGAVWNYNDIFGATYSGPAGEGNISVDPMFVSPMSDYHLQPGSLCIDTGDPGIFDFDSSRSDMGCYGGPNGNW